MSPLVNAVLFDPSCAILVKTFSPFVLVTASRKSPHGSIHSGLFKDLTGTLLVPSLFMIQAPLPIAIKCPSESSRTWYNVGSPDVTWKGWERSVAPAVHKFDTAPFAINASRLPSGVKSTAES